MLNLISMLLENWIIDSYCTSLFDLMLAILFDIYVSLQFARAWEPIGGSIYKCKHKILFC